MNAGEKGSNATPSALKWLAALSVIVAILGAAATVLTLVALLGVQLDFGKQTLVPAGLPYFILSLVCFGAIAYGLLAKHSWTRPILVGVWVAISVAVCVYAIRSPSHGVLDTVVKIPAVVMYAVSDIALIGYFYFKKEVVHYYRTLGALRRSERRAKASDTGDSTKKHDP